MTLVKEVNEGIVIQDTKFRGRPARPTPALKVIMFKNGVPVKVSAGYRVIVSKGGRAFISCVGENHKGRKLTPATDFYFALHPKSGYIFFTKCKKCLAKTKNASRAPHIRNHGFVSTRRMRPFLKEVIKKSGSKTRAAELCQTSLSGLLRWERCEGKNMRAASAAKILIVLRELK